MRDRPKIFVFLIIYPPYYRSPGSHESTQIKSFKKLKQKVDTKGSLFMRPWRTIIRWVHILKNQNFWSVLLPTYNSNLDNIYGFWIIVLQKNYLGIWQIMILKYLKRKLIQHMVIQNVNVKILVVAAVEKQLVSNCCCLLLIHMSHMIWVILTYSAFLFYSVIIRVRTIQLNDL